MAVNKNTVPGDKSAMNPGGIRLGTPAVTTRGANGEDIDKIVEFVDRGVQIAIEVQNSSGSKKMKDFRKELESKSFSKIDQLKAEVIEFANRFPAIGQ